jgi:Tol biopolymer transport system component
MSAEGRYVTFDTIASNLVAGDTNGTYDVFVHDMITGMTARASVASDGTQGNDRSYVPTLSSDGRYIVFNSDATNLVVGDTNGRTDVFLTLNPLAPHNQAPVLNPIGNKSVNEGQTLSFTLSATDPDTGDTLTYSATNTPPGSTFDPATRTSPGRRIILRRAIIPTLSS